MKHTKKFFRTSVQPTSPPIATLPALVPVTPVPPTSAPALASVAGSRTTSSSPTLTVPHSLTFKVLPTRSVSLTHALVSIRIQATLEGDFTAILVNATSVASFEAALAADLSAQLNEPVRIVSITPTVTTDSSGVVHHGLVVVFQTTAASSNDPEFQSRLATLSSTTSWLSSAKAAFEALGGVGSFGFAGVSVNARQSTSITQPFFAQLGFSNRNEDAVTSSTGLAWFIPVVCGLVLLFLVAVVFFALWVKRRRDVKLVHAKYIDIFDKTLDEATQDPSSADASATSIPPVIVVPAAPPPARVLSSTSAPPTSPPTLNSVLRTPSKIQRKVVTITTEVEVFDRPCTLLDSDMSQEKQVPPTAAIVSPPSRDGASSSRLGDRTPSINFGSNSGAGGSVFAHPSSFTTGPSQAESLAMACASAAHAIPPSVSPSRWATPSVIHTEIEGSIHTCVSDLSDNDIGAAGAVVSSPSGVRVGIPTTRARSTSVNSVHLASARGSSLMTGAANELESMPGSPSAPESVVSGSASQPSSLRRVAVGAMSALQLQGGSSRRHAVARMEPRTWTLEDIS